jgi:hypothetical protein
MITIHKDQTKPDRQLVEAMQRIRVLATPANTLPWQRHEAPDFAKLLTMISAIATNAITNTGGAL